LIWGLFLSGCSDPPAPAPVHTGPSMAPYVLWQEPEKLPVDKPIALFVDAPGGELDRLAADFDITTFLNDKFTPVFLSSTSKHFLRFYLPDGCPISPPLYLKTPSDWIAEANRIVLLLGKTFQDSCPDRFNRQLLQGSL
jgi:hypothetical protein